MTNTSDQPKVKGIKPVALSAGFKDFFKSLNKVRGTPSFSVTEQMLFAKRLSFLIGANVSLLESFYMLKEQARSSRVINVYERIISDISNGQYLSGSLKKFGKTFTPFAINLIRVGELSGSLSKNLVYLSEELKKRHELQKKIVGALVYPIIITIATLGITGMLTIFIFPKIMPIFISMNVQLPLTTKILLWISTFLRDNGIWVLVGIVVAFFLILTLYRKSNAVHFALDRAVLSTPITGPIARSYHMANFCRTLGLLLKSGLTLSEGMHIMTETVGNMVYSRAIARAGKGVTAGKQLSVMLTEEKKFFPHMLTHMIGIGERTGNLSGTLIYLSDLYESEVDDMTRNLSSAIEPVLMITMGLIVGLVAVSVISPIYEITQHLQR